MFKSRKINPWIMAGSYIFLSLFGRISEGVENPKILEVRKIWDQGKHNAFTDLIRFQNKWYCTFRESEGHVGGDGSIRLLESQDGEEWKSVANITEAGIDLRDPKLSIANDGRLMIVAGGSVYRGGRVLLSPTAGDVLEGWKELDVAKTNAGGRRLALAGNVAQGSGVGNRL